MELSTEKKNLSADLANREDASTVQSSDQTSTDITEAVFIFFNIYITTILLAVLSPVGVATNILNIIVYWNQGIRENANITFIALSFWDLLQCFLLFLSEIFLILQNHFPHPVVAFRAIQLVFLAYTRGCTYVLSTLVTVYLSIETSVCIILPFKVKNIFTTPRVVLVNVIIVVFGLACFCPAWATQGLHWVFEPSTNTTSLVLWLAVNRRDINLFVDTFNGIVIPTMAQLLITISGGFMMQGINKSNKFRQKDTGTRKPADVFNLNENTPTSSTRDKIRVNKEVKLTKVVVSIATIFFACNLPVILVAILRAMIPELDVGKSLFSWYMVLYGIVYCFGVINCTVNIFVYYSVSTRYRRDFTTLFCRTKFVKKI